MAGVGAGVGIPLALALVGTLMIIAKQRRRSRGMLQREASQLQRPAIPKTGYAAVATPVSSQRSYHLQQQQVPEMDSGEVRQKARYEMGHEQETWEMGTH